MDQLLFYVLVLVLGIVYTFVGYIISRSITTTQEYFLAGRSLGIMPLTISLTATQLGGGFILGTSRESYIYGYWGLLYVIGICLGFLLLSCGIASRLRALSIETTAQLFQLRYNSILLKKFASLCSILSLCGIFAAQVIASRTLMLALNVYNPLLFAVFWLLIISYAMMGGLKAIVKNDIFQLSFIIIIFTCLFIFDVSSNFAQAKNILFKSNDFFSAHALADNARILTVLLMPALYALIEQDLAQIFFAARNSRIAVVGAFSAALFLLFFAVIPLYFGMKMKVLGLPLTFNANPLMSYVNQTSSNSIIALVTYGVFAAIISSANAVLCAISSNIVQDFNIARFDKKHAVIIAQLVTLLVGISGLIAGFYLSDLIGVLVDSYALPVIALLVSLLVAYFTTGQLSTLAAYASIFTGLGTFIILLLSKTTLLISPELDALLGSAIGYILGLTIDQLYTRTSKL